MPSDLDKKFRIINLLRDNLKLYAMTDFVYLRDRKTDEVLIKADDEIQVIQATHEKYQVNLPDLYVKVQDIIIEIDGGKHGFNDDVTRNSQTNTRNDNYAVGGYTEENGKLIILTDSDLLLDDESLIGVLRGKLVK